MFGSGLLAVVVALGVVRVADGAGGITWLSDESYAKAIDCGRSGSDCAVAPYRLCASELDGYVVSLATPFSRVATSVFEAFRRQRRVRPLNEDAANGWGVGIYVAPDENSDRADGIRSVRLIRRGRPIAPLSATVGPMPAPNGTSRQLSRGFFAFPIEAFSPAADTTIVLTGAAGEARCTLSAEKLASLR
jgi:hypothetical protein